jgi:DNA replication protein DnaC
MLHHPTLDLLQELGLHGMAAGLKELRANAQAGSLTPEDWLGILLDHEISLRRQKRLETRTRNARLRHQAVFEDIDFRAPRGLDRAVFQRLGTCAWIRNRHHVLITGPAGIGKSWLACALGHKACRENFSVLYQRVPRLFTNLALAHGDGRYPKLLRSLTRVNLLILDDWGPETLNAEQRRDLLEIIEDRYDTGSLLITSQIPIDGWYDVVGNPTLADAILDRVVHNAYRLELQGESLRKTQAAALS